MAELGKFLTATQIAQTLGLSRSSVLSLARRGILPCGLKIGHSRRWRLEEVQRALELLDEGRHERGEYE